MEVTQAELIDGVVYSRLEKVPDFLGSSGYRLLEDESDGEAASVTVGNLPSGFEIFLDGAPVPQELVIERRSASITVRIPDGGVHRLQVVPK